ncbi:TetR/AcrR family transcriptional regulator [Mycobacterium sp. Y57]|uniref:TetR/AcrR family transcriptional regulator n=1 Tax=Mycolicibacterium xanthum TaxID=2796469 RepID=UPI001C8561A8|nr:TetR/AcrR family transcriptional regulator [Mycolicibacterium xanthum]MBX7430898.1 TetR/AcrR family transcriptional regulator [Mycolicibacterium xanthum]
MGEPSIAPRRSYDNRARREKAARTRDRIVTAGSELAHEFDSWDWRGLTFRAVAQRAGVGERTVYRHFPTERLLHDAVMERLEQDAGIAYEDVDLTNLDRVTGRVFASLHRFSVRGSVNDPHDPTFATVDQRRREALRRSVLTAAPQWSDTERRMAAGLLDVLWNVPAYERMVGAWGLDGPAATRAITWLMAKIVDAIEQGEPPPA